MSNESVQQNLHETATF